jgi:ABC-type branched-subunit amino acid transport system ATPase component
VTTLLELQNITIQFGGLMAVDHVNLKATAKDAERAFAVLCS